LSNLVARLLGEQVTVTGDESSNLSHGVIILIIIKIILIKFN